MNVYLDNGATTKTAPEVIKAMADIYSEKYGNASSLHKFGRDARDEIEKARKVIADKLRVLPDEVIFTSGGTESDNLAIRGIVHNSKEKHIITSKIEHHAVLNTCKALEKEGFRVTYVGVDDSGIVMVDEIEKAICDDTVLISIIHVNNEIGTIQPIEEIGKIARKRGVVFHTDAVQSLCKVDLDLRCVDLASFSGHKIHGPKGIGALYVKKGIKLVGIMDGGEQELKLRPGTENVAGAVGFAKAVEIFDKKGIEKMRDYLIDEILDIKDTKLNGNREKRVCNNVNIGFKYLEGESLLMQLDEKGIAVSTGSACTSSSLEPSHVLTAIGLKPEEAHGSIRFSLSRYTTKEELDYTLKHLKSVIENLRKISPLTEG